MESQNELGKQVVTFVNQQKLRTKQQFIQQASIKVVAVLVGMEDRSLQGDIETAIDYAEKLWNELEKRGHCD